MKSKLACIIFFLLISFNTGAVEIDRDHWREVKRNLHYKKAEAGKKEKQYEDWSKNIKDKKGSGQKSGSNRPKRSFLKSKSRSSSQQKHEEESAETEISQGMLYLTYILVGVVLLAVIYFLFFQNRKRAEKTVAAPAVRDEIQVDVPFNELEFLLQEAVTSGNYREAVRIYFIFIIKTLREKNWITWEKKKTNSAYLFEMRNRTQFHSFSQAVLIFEIVWYGKRDIAKEQYDKIRPQMDELIQSLNKES